MRSARELAAVLLTRARSLPSLWRRPQPRHARPEIPPHPRPFIPGLGHLDVPLCSVWRVPFPDGFPPRAEETATDMAPLVRPFTDHARPGRAGATEAARRAA